MSEFLKDKNIKYLNREFNSFKKDVIKFTEAHHSGVFKDFNESSPGMALIDVMCYIGDVLSFYQDQQFNELKQETARQEESVVSFAKSLGYKPKGKRSANGILDFALEVPATINGNGEAIPDSLYCPILRTSAKIGGPNSTVFETVDSIDFSSSIDRQVTGSRFDSNTGLPTHFAIRKSVGIIAGETKTDVVDVGDFEQFKTINLSEQDVIEVLSVYDSDGNEWVEVDYLAQETVFSSDVNIGSDNDVVPYILKLKTVPRRFVVDRDPVTNTTSLIFGSGDGVNFDDELLPNIADLALPLTGRRTFTSVNLDPQNFLKTRTLGLSPFDTTLTITYRVGGGKETNVGPGTIKDIILATLDFNSTNLNTSKKSDVEGSLECFNLSKTNGGGPKETISEIKNNSAAYFATQNRTVTKEDYKARIKTLPEKFGKPEKLNIKTNNVNGLSLDVHLLTVDENNHLSLSSNTLKNNIKTYLSQTRMITDGINLLDGDIINLKVNFGVVVSPKFNRTEVLTKCIVVIRDYLATENMEIEQPIVLSDLSAKLQEVVGVISVYDLSFTNLIDTVDGLQYSQTRFDVQSNIKNNILYCPKNAIFEIKYPQKDIVGVAK